MSADRHFRAAVVLAAHPHWSYPDLLATPVPVLQAMDAIAQARGRRRAAEAGQ